MNIQWKGRYQRFKMCLKTKFLAKIFIRIKNVRLFLFVKPWTRVVWELHSNKAREAFGYGSMFFLIDSWGKWVLHLICLRNKSERRTKSGSHQSGIVNFFRLYFPKNFNCRQCINHRPDTFLTNLGFEAHSPKTYSSNHLFASPHLATSKTPSFSQFFGKPGASLHIFWSIIKQAIDKSPLETSPKRR